MIQVVRAELGLEAVGRLALGAGHDAGVGDDNAPTLLQLSVTARTFGAAAQFGPSTSWPIAKKKATHRCNSPYRRTRAGLRARGGSYS
jgi:hypothetical protein